MLAFHINLFIMYLGSGKLMSTHNKVLKLVFSKFFNSVSKRSKLRQKRQINKKNYS